MKRKVTLRLFLAFVGCALIAISSASAQGVSNTWDTDASGNWTNVNNWLGDTAYASGADNTATLGDVISSERTITLDAPITIGNITVSDTSHNYTISGANALTLDVTTGSPTITVPAGRTLTISSNTAGSDGLTKAGEGTLALGFKFPSYTGVTIISEGALKCSAKRLPGGQDVTVDGGTLDIGNGQTYLGALTLISGNILTAGGNTDIFANNNFFYVRSGSIAANLEGSGSLTKTTSGAVTLSGVNTYSGPTTVSNGTLNVSGSIGNSAVTVETGGTLGGSGTIGGAITVDASGTIAPGESSVGTLTAAAGATLNGALAVEIDGVSIDLLAVTGTLDMSNATIDFQIITSPTESSYELATATTISGTPTLSNVPAGYTVTVEARAIKLDTIPGTVLTVR